MLRFPYRWYFVQNLGVFYPLNIILTDDKNKKSIMFNRFLQFILSAPGYPKGGLDQNPPIGSAIFQVLGVFMTSCTCIVNSRNRGCFHKWIGVVKSSGKSSVMAY